MHLCPLLSSAVQNHAWRHLAEILLEKRTLGPYIVLQKCKEKALEFNLVPPPDLSARGARAGRASLVLYEGLLLGRGWVRSILSALTGMSRSAGAASGCLQAKGMDGHLPRVMQATFPQTPVTRLSTKALNLLCGHDRERGLQDPAQRRPWAGMPLKAAELGVTRGAGCIPRTQHHR